ncbi:hypothetical protein F4604DRAFT_1819613 [Suillus subluteus]|nr:hypothetical protein F4604DRAFT_1819613 [Suillus subluteus]
MVVKNEGYGETSLHGVYSLHILWQNLNLHYIVPYLTFWYFKTCRCNSGAIRRPIYFPVIMLFSLLSKPCNSHLFIIASDILRGLRPSTLQPVLSFCLFSPFISKY